MKKMVKKKAHKVVSQPKVLKTVGGSFRSNYSFLVVLFIFAGVSLYALASFFSSTSNYIQNMRVSVADGVFEEEVVTDDNPIVAIFSDVREGDANAEAILALYNSGVIKGYEDGTFRPLNTVNRAELLTILTTAVDADFSGKAYGNCFSDVTDQWFSVFVCYAKESGWVKGFEDNSYKPDQSVTKAEAVKIVFEAFGYNVCESMTESSYKDVSLTDWYAPYACAAKRDGILPKDMFFSPEYRITRGEFSELIYNVMVKRGLLQ